MRIDELMDILVDFGRLGWAVQEQLQDIIDGEDIEDQNINTLKMIKGFLETCQEYGAEVIDGHGGVLTELTDYFEEEGISVGG